MELKVLPGIDLYCAITRRQMGSCCFRCVLTSEDELPLVGIPTILMALLVCSVHHPGSASVPKLVKFSYLLTIVDISIARGGA